MDIDAYRFAYNVLHCTWIKFGIPDEEIPPPRTDKVDSLDAIIPGFSVAVVLYQIASRKDLKTFLDNKCPTVHNLMDVYSRFQYIMKQVLPNGNTDMDSPTDAASGGLPERATGEDPVEGHPSDMILFENIPAVIAYSLAVCTEMVLYKREGENNKGYIKSMPDMWEKYFKDNLRALCENARCTQNDLKDFAGNVKCPDKFLNKFISENKNEYNNIADKFCEYTKKKFAEGSPVHMKVVKEAKAFAKGLHYPKMKETFKALKNICKCVHASQSDDQNPLISADFSSSQSTTPSSEAESFQTTAI